MFQNWLNSRNHGGVLGIISTVLVVVLCSLVNAISSRFISFKWLWWSNISFICCWTMDNFSIPSWAFYKYINTQKLLLSGIIFKVIMSKWFAAKKYYYWFWNRSQKPCLQASDEKWSKNVFQKFWWCSDYCNIQVWILHSKLLL